MEKTKEQEFIGYYLLILKIRGLHGDLETLTNTHNTSKIKFTVERSENKTISFELAESYAVEKEIYERDYKYLNSEIDKYTKQANKLKNYFIKYFPSDKIIEVSFDIRVIPFRIKHDDIIFEEFE